MVKEYYSTTECAEILRVSRITVFNWIKSRKLEAKQHAGNYLVSNEELDKFRESRGLREKEKKALRGFANFLIKNYGDFLRTID